jgi:hypothetical protein
VEKRTDWSRCRRWDKKQEAEAVVGQRYSTMIGRADRFGGVGNRSWTVHILL